MDPTTAGSWSVERDVCQACRVRDAEMDNDSEGGRPRGVKYIATRTQLPPDAVEE